MYLQKNLRNCCLNMFDFTFYVYKVPEFGWFDRSSDSTSNIYRPLNQWGFRSLAGFRGQRSLQQAVYKCPSYQLIKVNGSTHLGMIRTY